MNARMMPTFDPVAMRRIVLNRANKLATNSNFYIDGFEAYKMGNLVQAIFETIESQLQQAYEAGLRDACAEALAIPTDSKQVLSDWLDSVLGEPIAWSHHCSDNNDQEFYCVDYEPNNGMSVHRGDVPLFKKPEIK